MDNEGVQVQLVFNAGIDCVRAHRAGLGCKKDRFRFLVMDGGRELLVVQGVA